MSAGREGKGEELGPSWEQGSISSPSVRIRPPVWAWCQQAALLVGQVSVRGQFVACICKDDSYFESDKAQI